MIGGESWQKAEIPGPIKAFLIDDPKRLAILIKRAKRPLIIVGYKTAKMGRGEFNLVDYILDLAKRIKAHIVVTGSLIKEFDAKGYEHVYLMPAMEVTDRLRDPGWNGFDGGGNYDLAIFLGFPYYYEWVMLNGLKHFAYKHLRTISLDPYYQPNATFSPPNMSFKEWVKYLDSLKNNL